GRADGGRAGGIEIDGPGGGRDACSKIRGADGDACAAGGDVALRRSERGHAVLGDQDRSDAIVVGVGQEGDVAAAGGDDGTVDADIAAAHQVHVRVGAVGGEGAVEGDR